ncbi:MAG: hypothetical protein ABI782_06390 [Anaerolineaceae bacterium]
MQNWIRTSLGLFAAATVALAVVVSPANASGNTQISGVGTFDSDETCMDTDHPSVFTMVITGDLVGCWYTNELEVVHDTPSGAYAEVGTETFVGCYRVTMCGTFNTTYRFSGKFVDGLEVFGRCEHPLVSGTGDFEGITGRVDFKDNVQTGVAYYRGHFQLR